jgi:hypothetical protein
MLKRYQVTLLRETRREWTVCMERRFRTLSAAERWAERVLARHPNVHTRYFSRDDITFSASFQDLRTGLAAAEDMDAPEYIVPSVGEIGVW